MRVHNGPSDDGYDASRAVFDTVVAFLDGDEAAGMDHAELEDQLQQRSRQLFCRLFQDHLDRRAQRERRVEAVADADGVGRPSVEAGHHRGSPPCSATSTWNASPAGAEAGRTCTPPTGR